MKLLAVDTSTNFLCLGLSDGQRPYEYNLELGRRLSSLLAPAIKKTLEALGWGIEEIDYFACGLGPGSFTGLRIGLACVKGMAWALHKPVAGIPSLDILAAGAGQGKRPVTVIIDAKRGLVYCGIYKFKNGRLKAAVPYALLSEKEMLGAIRNDSVILGNGLDLYREKILQRVKGAVILDKDYWYPKAHNMITLALERIKDKKLGNAFDIRPIYLYPKECQIRSV